MHLHYSPFQFATGVEVSTGDVSAMKVEKVLKALTKKDTSKTHDMHSTMPCHEAARIPGTPTAFISPNSVGAMKDLKTPMAPALVSRKPPAMAAEHYNHEYRSRGRVGYGDRME